MRIRVLALIAVAVAAGFAACPIAPDFGVDSGVVDSGTDEDAGVDAGITGSISATLTVSDSTSTTALAWNGTEVDTSTLDSTSEATLRGVSDATLAGYGSLTLQLTNLTVGGTGAIVNAASYTPLSGADTGWSCIYPNCNAVVAISDFDGVNLEGTFAIEFGTDSANNTAALSNGVFSISFE